MTPKDVQILADCARNAAASSWPFRKAGDWMQLKNLAIQCEDRVTMGWTPLGSVELKMLIAVLDILAQGPTLEIRVAPVPGPETLARLRDFQLRSRSVESNDVECGHF